MPAILFKIGLGFILPRQMFLTTIGRKTGKPHKVVVDIVKHDKDNDVYFVNAAWGLRSDWFKNLVANPNVQVQVARRKFSGKATVLPSEEAGEILVEFINQHPIYVRIMMRLIGIKIRFNEEDICSLVSEMPIVAIRT
jgi:deazaflavin-dependent oxidoreductase (nitroreductase family)